MNHDEKFQKRWDFRRREVDEDSLSDDNIDTHKTLQMKVESNKKKNLVQMRSNKKKRNGINKEMAMIEDLKVFADSLIHEVTVAREKMLAYMRDEMRKLVSSRPNVEPLEKNKMCPLDGVEPNYRSLKNNEPNNYSDQVVSSSYLTLPTVLPKPHFQNRRNGFPMNNSGVENNFYHQFSEFNPEQGFGNFCQISSKSVSFLGQNSVQTAGFPVPLHHGTEYGSNISSLSYGENSFLDNIRICPVRFPSEGKFPNNISSNVVTKTAGEIDVTRS